MRAPLWASPTTQLPSRQVPSCNTRESTIPPVLVVREDCILLPREGSQDHVSREDRKGDSRRSCLTGLPDL